MTIMTMMLFSAAALMTFCHIAATRIDRQQRGRKARMLAALPVPVDHRG